MESIKEITKRMMVWRSWRHKHEPVWMQRVDSPNFPGKSQQDYILGCVKCLRGLKPREYIVAATYPTRDDLMERM